MVNVYTSYKGLDKDKILIDSETYFDFHFTTDNINAAAKEIMFLIDKAEYLGGKWGSIQTPFGVGTIKNLSTGCKIVLNYLLLRENKAYGIMDVTEAGANALEVLFALATKFDDDTTIFILRHGCDLFDLSNRDYLINGIECSADLLGLE